MKKNPRQDVAELIGGLQQQIVSLERKIDLLLNRPQHQAQTQPQLGPRQFEQTRQRLLYRIVCADCGKASEIPFKPSPGRPVYCKECFSRRKNSGGLFKAKQEGRFIERDFTKPAPTDKQDAKKSAKKKKAKRKK
jgi:CxxC-x17-CxxC domain-containing protein